MRRPKESRRRSEISVLLVLGTTLAVHGGRERWIIETAKLLRRFTNVSILAITDSNVPQNISLRLMYILNELKKYDVAYYEVKTFRTKLGPLRRIPHSLLKTTRILRKHHVIYVAGDLYFGLLISILSLLAGTGAKVIVGLHVSPSPRRLRYATPVIKVLDKLGIVRVFHTINIVDYLYLTRLVRVKAKFIPNYVNCSKFKPIAMKRNGNFQVLFVGALEKKKGIDIFIKLAERFRNEVPESRFVVTSYGGSWEGVVMDYSRKGIIEYLGFVDDDELVKLYSESHVLIMPSRKEPFGLVAVEAEACGTPVISSNLPAFRLTVVNGVTGFRVKNVEDIEEWSNALWNVYKQLKYKREEYELMCMKAREYVCRNFYRNVIKSLVKLILL